MMAKQKFNIYISQTFFCFPLSRAIFIIVGMKGYKESVHIRLAFNVLEVNKKMLHHGNNYGK
jgi:hypothetical protein